MPRKQVKAPPVKYFGLRFPAMGVMRNQAHEREYAAVEYPTPWAVNVRLEDALSSRLRGGSWTPIAAEVRPVETVYRDRLLTIDGALISASRQGDHTDFQFSGGFADKARPVMFQLSKAAETGEAVVGLVPCEDRTLLAATAGSLWILRGDPVTGDLHRISRDVGMLYADAWCRAGNDVYFLAADGLCSVSIDGSDLKLVSDRAIPYELKDVTDTGCTLTYSHEDKGVYVHLPNSSVSWFYDIKNNGFWPFTLASTDSHLLIGPVRLSQGNYMGLVQTLHGIVASGSGAVNWRIVKGDTAEAAAANGKLAIEAHLASGDWEHYVSAAGVWEAGRSVTAWPRVQAGWVVLWLHSTATWAFEACNMEVIPGWRF